MLKFQCGNCFSLILLLCMTGPLVATESEETPGDSVAEVSAETEKTREPTVEDNTYVPTPEDMEAMDYYRELMSKLEREGGVYDSQLSEVIVGLGNLYQKMGRHGDAAQLFQRAYHITRVNTGLYSLDQLAILEELIESNRSLKNWEELNNNYHNLLWISKRHHGENNPELLSLIERVGRWHMTAWDLDEGENPFATSEIWCVEPLKCAPK